MAAVASHATVVASQRSSAEESSARFNNKSVAKVDGPAISGFNLNPAFLGRPRDQWDGERHDQRFAVHLLRVLRADGKDHADCDQEQHDAARDADAFLLDLQQLQGLIPCEQEEHEDAIGDQHFADDDGASAFGADFLEYAQEDRHVAERIHDQEQRDHGGDEAHLRSISQSLALERLRTAGEALERKGESG